MSGSVVQFSGIPTDSLSLWQTLQPNPRYGFFFGSGAGSDNDHHLYFSVSEPIQSWVIQNEAALRNFEKALKKQSQQKKQRIPRFVGYFGFETGRLFDQALAALPRQKNSLNSPLAEWSDYPAIVHVDQKKKITQLWIDSRVSREKKTRIEQQVRRFFTFAASAEFLTHPHRMNKLPKFSRFEKMMKQAKAHIEEGDIYQANLSLRFAGSFSEDPRQLYRRLCEKNPSPYACILKNSQGWVVSSSPELLLDVSKNHVRTRPIAGTRPRGKATDRRLKGQLLLSPKERAEHIMLVDLARNDLGRVCRPGSVRVSDRYQVETYSHVMHIVSEVEGLLQKKENSFSALKALFPAGTITGCPKIKAIEIIEQLEAESRGPFYGSAGFFSDNGDAVFNILIRTATIQNKRATVQAGAGIVADSQAKREYREIWAKARALLEAIQS